MPKSTRGKKGKKMVLGKGLDALIPNLKLEADVAVVGLPLGPLGDNFVGIRGSRRDRLSRTSFG